MRRLTLFLLTSLILPCGFSQQNSPLTEGEKRQILGQLIELKSARATISAYESFIKREAELYEQEKANWARAIELEKQATVLAQKERDLALEKAGTYEQLYKTVTKKRGIGCTLKKIFTFGIARCG